MSEPVIIPEAAVEAAARVLPVYDCGDCAGVGHCDVHWQLITEALIAALRAVARDTPKTETFYDPTHEEAFRGRDRRVRSGVCGLGLCGYCPTPGDCTCHCHKNSCAPPSPRD